MKRFLTVFLAALMILLAGCTKTPAPIGDNPTTTQPTTLSQQEIAEKNYYDSIPKMSKENQEIYDKYIYPYEGSWMFDNSWDEENHSEIDLIGSVYIHFYGSEEFSKDHKRNSDDNYILDFEDVKKKFKEKMVISEDELKKLFGEYYDKEKDEYVYPYAHCGPEDSIIITDVKTKNSIITITFDVYSILWREEGKTFKYDKDGNIYAIPIAHSTLKIKLEDNGKFKFLSNEIKKS